MKTITPPLGTSDEVQTYLKNLKEGERVIEAGKCCMTGCLGTVYISKNGGGLCVLWDKQFGQDGQMGTSVTWGTRRIEDVQD